MKKKRKSSTRPISKKPVTIDELAGMVAHGFGAMESSMQNGFAQVGAHIDGVEEKLNSLHSEVLSMNYDHKKLKVRLENVEVRLFGSIQEP